MVNRENHIQAHRPPFLSVILLYNYAHATPMKAERHFINIINEDVVNKMGIVTEHEGYP